MRSREARSTFHTGERRASRRTSENTGRHTSSEIETIDSTTISGISSFIDRTRKTYKTSTNTEARSTSGEHHGQQDDSGTTYAFYSDNDAETTTHEGELCQRRQEATRRFLRSMSTTRSDPKKLHSVTPYDWISQSDQRDQRFLRRPTISPVKPIEDDRTRSSTMRHLMTISYH
eukprot:6135235-Amphidinium_carterae.6